MRRACLLIHGFLSSDEDFNTLIPLLKKYDKVVNLRLPGHGKGGNLKEFTVEATFNMVEEAFQSIAKEYRSIDLIGFSMGGALCTYLGSKYKCRRIVLLAPANHFINIHQLLPRLKMYVQFLKKRLTKSDDINIYHKAIRNMREDDYHSLQIIMKELIPNYNYHTLSTFFEIIRRCNKNLRKIEVPVLIMWGTIDQIIPYKVVKKLSRICPNHKVVILEAISHLMLGSKEKGPILNNIMSFLNTPAHSLVLDNTKEIRLVLDYQLWLINGPT